MVALSDLRGVDLTPEEGYLLSRIDGRISVGALLSMVSWERDKTMALLESLLRKHVLNFDRREIHDQAFGKTDGTKKVTVSASPTKSNGPAPINPDTIERVADLDSDRCIEIL